MPSTFFAPSFSSCLTSLTCGLRSAARFAAATIFELPTSRLSKMIWRCKLDSSTASKSTMPSVPTPEAARYKIAGEPSPPTPSTSTLPCFNRVCPRAPTSGKIRWRLYRTRSCCDSSQSLPMSGSISDRQPPRSGTRIRLISAALRRIPGTGAPHTQKTREARRRIPRRNPQPSAPVHAPRFELPLAPEYPLISAALKKIPRRNPQPSAPVHAPRFELPLAPEDPLISAPAKNKRSEAKDSEEESAAERTRPRAALRVAPGTRIPCNKRRAKKNPEEESAAERTRPRAALRVAPGTRRPFNKRARKKQEKRGEGCRGGIRSRAHPSTRRASSCPWHPKTL